MRLADGIEPPPHTARTEQHRLILEEGADRRHIGGQRNEITRFTPLHKQSHVGEVGFQGRGGLGAFEALEFCASIGSTLIRY